MYTCTEEGCSRKFKRSEHLSRHRLNHRPRKIHQCLVCHKDFVRLDLLQRHIRRHDRGMSYRNSGGYSNSGRPSTGSLLEEVEEEQEQEGHSRTPSETPSESVYMVGLRGQLSSVADGADGDSVLHTAQKHGGIGEEMQVDVQDHEPEQEPVLAHMLEPPRPGSVQQADHEPPRLGDRLDVEHLTFFDGSNDAVGLTQDLDWLFGTSPWDIPTELLGPNALPPSGEVSEISPSSEGSRGRAAGLGQLEAVYLVPRERILAALTSLPAEILTSSFFEDENLERFIENYWQQYNRHFCLLHRPTFSVQDAPPLLLVALLTLGATLSTDNEHYLVAEKIHQNLRWLIFTSPSFQAPAPLWVVQALLVIQAYEKMVSSRRLHEMSHIFHYSVITLMRRGSFYSLDREDDGDVSSLEKEWYRWIERESSYRAAYFAFIMDAQHSSIFGHTAALTLSDLHLPLPCADALWDAPTAANWNRERSRAQPTPFFLPALRALLSRHPIPHTYSPFARFALLHGLFCLTRHMITRDQTASCINVASEQPPAGLENGSSSSSSENSSAEQDNWKDRLDRAIDTWSFSLLSQTPSLCLEAARPLQRIAHVGIHVSLVDFHTLAGAPNLATGVRADPRGAQFARARDRVFEWASHRNAKRTLSHCLLLIQETMFTRTRYIAADDNIILRPWVLYNMTLVLWAYGAITEAARGQDNLAQGQAIQQHQHQQRRRRGHQDLTLPSQHSRGKSLQWSAEEYLAHMLNGLMGDSDLSQLQCTNRTAGLITAVRTALEGCKWELLEEARDTLGRLSENPDIFMPIASR
ncbi:fungal-specific transcription factor domain-containing protein [Xylariales sp. PMI_506]|nr:fungal-specific transcription factor domain-containing protein [Xylariales sp. PMI_506]